MVCSEARRAGALLRPMAASVAAGHIWAHTAALTFGGEETCFRGPGKVPAEHPEGLAPTSQRPAGVCKSRESVSCKGGDAHTSQRNTHKQLFCQFLPERFLGVARRCNLKWKSWARRQRRGRPGGAKALPGAWRPDGG
eukprot:4130685-Prymnesium_polylepis.2